MQRKDRQKPKRMRGMPYGNHRGRLSKSESPVASNVVRRRRMQSEKKALSTKSLLETYKRCTVIKLSQ